MENVKAPRPITVKGIKVMFDPEVLDDFELVDMIGQVQDGDAFKVPTVFKRILGEDVYKQVMDALRNEKGRVPVQAAAEFLAELLKKASPNS